MAKKPSSIDFNTLEQDSQEEVNQRIRELRQEKLTYNQIIQEIKKEMRVIIKQHHIAKAIKAITESPAKSIHMEEEIQQPEDELKDFSIEDLRESISYSTRQIIFNVQGNSLTFNLVRLSEAKKYGKKTSEKIDENMRLCLTATYSLYDNIIFPLSRTIKGKGKLTKKEIEEGVKEKIIEKSIPAGIKKGTILLDSDGDFTLRKDIKEVDLEGNPLEIYPSSLSFKNAPREIELKDVIDIDQVLDHDIHSQYILFPVEGQDDSVLREILNDLQEAIPPKFLALQFNWYPSTTPQDAFLQLFQESDNEYIVLLVGTKIETEYIGLEEFPEESGKIEEDFELDFEL